MNSANWVLVRGRVQGLNWNEIIRSSLNETLLHYIRDIVPKRTIVARRDNKSWFHNRCILVHRAKQRVYEVWNRSKMQANWKEYGVARRHARLVYEDAERLFMAK